MSFGEVRIDGGLLEVVINTGFKGNRLSTTQIGELASSLRDVPANHSLRAVFVRGEGDFCRGRNDYPETTSVEVVADIVNGNVDLLRAFQSITAPKVVHISGCASGLGAAFALSADFVFMAPDGHFSWPEKHAGFTPLLALHNLMARTSRQHAMWLILSGQDLPAARARELGLVTEVLDEAAARQAAAGLVADREYFDAARTFARAVEQVAPSTKLEFAVESMIDEMWTRKNPTYPGGNK